MELPPYRSYVWVWRVLIAAMVLTLVVAAIGACWSRTSCPMPMTVLPPAYANFLATNWWLVLIAGLGASNYYFGLVLILCNTRLPWWGRTAWAIVSCVIPLACVAYWIDCVERADARYRIRATRFAAAAVATWLLGFGIAVLVWQLGMPWGRNAEIAAGSVAIAIAAWFFLRAFGWQGFARRREAA